MINNKGKTEIDKRKMRWELDEWKRVDEWEWEVFKKLYLNSSCHYFF